LFPASSKLKNKEIKKSVQIENDIMKKETFNEDLIFKKKVQPERKAMEKPKNNLFAEGSDDEQLDFRKKTEKEKQTIVIPPPPPKTKTKTTK
jgi:hypothetical protein